MTYKPMNTESDQALNHPKYNPGKSFAADSERVSEAGRKGQGAVQGNMRRDTGRSVESGHRSNEQRPAGGNHSGLRSRS
jgi:general stress protein YciG